MNWPKFALIAVFVLAALAWVAPWVTGTEIGEWPDALRWALGGGILFAMFVVGRDERRKEREADSWVNDPRRSKLQNWMEKRRQRFSPKRGVEFFFFGLVGFSIMLGIDALSAESFSIAGGVALVLIFSLLAGLFGMFTEKVPF